MLRDQVLLITGGTGSFGRAVLNHLLHAGCGEIRIFSRDEKKQDEMRSSYQRTNIKFYIGDVRDRDSVEEAMVGVDHAAITAAVAARDAVAAEAAMRRHLTQIEATTGEAMKRAAAGEHT